jgi:hypothetical protein
MREFDDLVTGDLRKLVKTWLYLWDTPVSPAIRISRLLTCRRDLRGSHLWPSCDTHAPVYSRPLASGAVGHAVALPPPLCIRDEPPRQLYGMSWTNTLYHNTLRGMRFPGLVPKWREGYDDVPSMVETSCTIVNLLRTYPREKGSTNLSKE